MPPGQKRLRLPVMTVNGVEPDAKGNVVVDPPDLTELEGRIDGLADAVDEENQRAVGAEEELGRRIAAEESRAKSVERGLMDDVSSAQTAIADRYTKRETDEKIAAATPSDYDSVKGRVAAVEAKVPAQASAQNQLADKAFVNSSVATNTANYVYKTVGGRHVPFDSLADLQGYAGALTNNDYAFVVGADAAGNTTYTRYKWNGSTEEWAEEYVINNSSFTAEQWATISSGITSGLVAKLGALPTAEALAQALAGKQDRLTFETSVTRNSDNPVKSSGIWSAIWGALSALPTGFASLYDWCVAQLAGKVPTSRTVNGKALTDDVTLTADDIDYSVPGGAQSVQMTLDGMDAELSRKASKSDVDPLLFAQFYPDGSVKSAAEFTAGIKYGSFDDVHRTVSVLPFCNTGTATNDNSRLVGRVVIPPFVDASGNGYISDDGTRYKVVGVSNCLEEVGSNTSLTAIVASTTLTTVGSGAFLDCTSLTSVSLPAATTVGDSMFGICRALTSVDFGATPRSSVPFLGPYAFHNVPPSCKIIVPYTQYDAWIAADGWKDLPQEFVRHAEKADKPATFIAGNLVKFDSQGDPTDSGKKPSDFATAAQGAKADAALSRAEAESGFTEWTFTPPGEDGKMFSTRYIDNGWRLYLGDTSTEFVDASPADSTELSWSMGAVTATRVRLPKMADLDAKASRAPNPTTGNLAALDEYGNPADAGYRLDVRNGIPCIIQTVAD